MAAPPPTKLDGNQVLKHVYEDATGELRVKATLNPGGSSEVIINHEDDSIRLGDGTNFITSTTDGPKVGLDVSVINDLTVSLPTGASTEAKQDIGNASLASIDSKLTAPISVTGPLTDAELRASPVPVSATLSDEPIKISGTENGQPGGIEYTFVNNIRSQILAAKDRDQAIMYADFGTKNQRVIQIDYTAPSIGVGVGFTARKTLSYTLVGTRYRRDNITWSVV